MYYVRNEPSTLEWSTDSINVSRLKEPEQVTKLRYMVAGEMTWNGFLPEGSEDGPKWPTRPKISIKCLRDGDLLHLRNIIKTYSRSGTYLYSHPSLRGP